MNEPKNPRCPRCDNPGNPTTGFFKRYPDDSGFRTVYLICDVCEIAYPAYRVKKDHPMVKAGKIPAVPPEDAWALPITVLSPCLLPKLPHQVEVVLTERQKRNEPIPLSDLDLVYTDDPHLVTDPGTLAGFDLWLEHDTEDALRVEDEAGDAPPFYEEDHNPPLL
jgi:hypothetical protein